MSHRLSQLRQSPARLRLRQLTHEVACLFRPSLHHQARPASRAGQLWVGGFLPSSCLLESCSVVVCTLPTSAPVPSDRRHEGCIEVVAEGHPLFGRAQLAPDTTWVSPVRADGTARRGAAHTDGVALAAARRQKERTYPELVGPLARARLVVLASEIGNW